MYTLIPIYNTCVYRYACIHVCTQPTSICINNIHSLKLYTCSYKAWLFMSVHVLGFINTDT